MGLLQMYDQFGSWERAVAAYHAGPKRVEEERLGPATRTYVQRVLRRWRSSTGK